MKRTMEHRLTVRTKAAAEILDVSENWLKKDRAKKNPAGPKFIKRGRMILYPVENLKQWAQEA